MNIPAAENVTFTTLKERSTFNLGTALTLGGLTQANPTSVYIVSGSGSLTQAVNIQPDAANTYDPGTQFMVLWECTLAPAGHTISVCGTDYTVVLTGAVNTAFLLIYDGTNWQVYNDLGDIFTALSGYAQLAGAAFTGAVTVPTVSGTTDNTQNAASTEFVQAIAALLAPKASPALTGNPTAPTQTAADNSTKIATTAYADAGKAAAIAVGNAAQTTANTANTNATAAQSQITALTALQQVAAWAAGAQAVIPSANLQYINVAAVNGNVTLNFTPISNSTPISEIVLIMTFTGSYTITAGTNSSFTTITGASTVTKVLRLSWNGTSYFGA